MHIALPVGRDIILMGSDSGAGTEMKMGNNISITLSLDDKEETLRLYEKLSHEGKINLPIQKTYWAELYAMFEDKFGINWMVNYGFK